MFFNKNLYKQISSSKYTTKQAITYFLLAYYNTKKINTEQIMKSIIKKIITIKPQEVLTKYYCQYLRIYGSEWSLTLNQLLSYSYIVCEEILKTNDKLESFEIICIFNKYLKDFTPNRLKNMLKAKSLGFFNLSSM